MQCIPSKRKAISKKHLNVQPDQHTTKQSPITKPQCLPSDTEEEFEKLQLRQALLAALQENEILRRRLIELQALSVEAQEYIQTLKRGYQRQILRIRQQLFSIGKKKRGYSL